MSTERGLKTAVETVLDRLDAPPGAEQAEQIDLEDLLGMPPRPAPTSPAPGADPAGARRPGRPPGSRNRRTEAWCDYILARYASPLEVLAQIAVARVDDLTSQLACTKLEAMQEKRHAAIALAPFLHQRQPLAVNLTERKVVYLTIEATEAAPATPGDSIVIPVEVIPPNQRLSAPAPDKVERAKVERDG